MTLYAMYAYTVFCDACIPIIRPSVGDRFVIIQIYYRRRVSAVIRVIPPGERPSGRFAHSPHVFVLIFVRVSNVLQCGGDIITKRSSEGCIFFLFLIYYYYTAHVFALVT